MEKLITIVGPTAVGKTELTLLLAEQFKSSIISGDAYQVYKGMNIGTAKPSLEELSKYKHYLIDILEPQDSYSVADFQAEANKIIASCNKEGHVPILSGGTGLYVQALLEDFNFSSVMPDVSIRNRLDSIFKEEGLEGILKYANSLAEPAGIDLPYKDKHRLYRAIELMLQGDYKTICENSKNGRIFQGPVIGLKRSREKLYERINLRVDLMIKQGLIEEVEGLLHKGINPKSQAFKAIGYKEVVNYLQGIWNKEKTIEEIKKNTRHFAKRQLTWYQRMPYIEWIELNEEMVSHEVLEKAKIFIDKELN